MPGSQNNPQLNPQNSLGGITYEDFRGKTISEILKEKGKIADDQLKEVKYSIASKQGSEESIISSKGFVDNETLVKAKAASYGMPYVDLGMVDIAREVIQKLPYDTAKTHSAIVFKDEPNMVHVGMADPLDIQKVQFLQSYLKKPIKTYFASINDINNVTETRYTGKIESEVTEAVEEVGEDVVQIEEGIQDISEVAQSIASAPVARIVNMILEYGVKFKASDIHIEPIEGMMAVIFRIHGIMNERLQLPYKLLPSIVARIKILSNLKIDEHRVPQDGRFQIKVGKIGVDLRVSVLPTDLW